jgi:hypothetical protein
VSSKSNLNPRHFELELHKLSSTPLCFTALRVGAFVSYENAFSRCAIEPPPAGRSRHLYVADSHDASVSQPGIVADTRRTVVDMWTTYLVLEINCLSKPTVATKRKIEPFDE